MCVSVGKTGNVRCSAGGAYLLLSCGKRGQIFLSLDFAILQGRVMALHEAPPASYLSAYVPVGGCGADEGLFAWWESATGSSLGLC